VFLPQFLKRLGIQTSSQPGQPKLPQLVKNLFVAFLNSNLRVLWFDLSRLNLLPRTVWLLPKYFSTWAIGSWVNRVAFANWFL